MFATFRRHQKKLMAIIAVLAMGGFVLSDTLPSLFNRGYGGPRGDAKVVELYGKTIRRTDLGELDTERRLANGFMGSLMGRVYGFADPRFAQFFGDTSTRSLVDALILQHEADKL